MRCPTAGAVVGTRAAERATAAMRQVLRASGSSALRMAMLVDRVATAANT